MDSRPADRLSARPPVSVVVCRSSRGSIGRRPSNDEVRARFHRPLPRRMAYRAGSGGATGAGARGLNLSEAKGRDVCAEPTLPVWPGPTPPPPLVAHLYAPYATAAAGCAGTPSTMIAAGKLIDREAAHSLRTWTEFLAISLRAGAPRIAIVRRSVGGDGQTQSAYLPSVGGKADVRGRHYRRRSIPGDTPEICKSVKADPCSVRPRIHARSPRVKKTGQCSRRLATR